MSITATVKNGVLVLPPEVSLPEGAQVQLILPEPAAGGSFAERYAAYLGAAADLPTDLAANVDHYVHGHGKP